MSGPTRNATDVPWILDQPRPIRDGESLDLAKLEAYLREQCPHVDGALTVEQFLSGYSNLTYFVKLGDQEFVLRRPPFGNQVKSAHDMGREFKVLSRLCKVYEPAPRPIAYCDDPTVIGDEFYLMERRRGVILRGAVPPTALASDPVAVRRLCEAFVQNLAQLHTLDYRAAGLSELGKLEGYVERQVSGWTQRFDKARTESVPKIDDLAHWLQQNLPTPHAPSLIHNDYKYDNLILDPDDVSTIVAVLDWEMATVGDPLMDLGTTLAYWIQPNDPEPQRARAFGPTMADGSFTRQELVERYAAASGFELSNVLFYYCFGVFKLAGIVQQIYARYVRGVTKDPRFAQLHHVVASLAVAGTRAIESGRI